MKFCPRCGKKGITGEFCKGCHAEMIDSIIEFKEIKINICPVCMTYTHRNKTTKFDDLMVVVRKVAKDSLKKKVNAEINPILPDIEYKPGKKYSIEIEIALSEKEKYYLPAEIIIEPCNKCNKAKHKYFEGVLQLRNPNKEVIDFIKDDVLSQKSRGIFITDEQKAGNGVDLYFTSQKYLQTIGHKLQNNFGGILKVNPRLFSRDKITSKDIYRVNVYFELIGFKRGDIVKYNSNLLRVVDTGKHIAAVNIKTGKNTAFSCKEKVEVLEKKAADVVKVYPDIEVLDPETYQPMKIENTKKARIGDHVNIIIDEGKAYIV